MLRLLQASLQLFRKNLQIAADIHGEMIPGDLMNGDAALRQASPPQFAVVDLELVLHFRSKQIQSPRINLWYVIGRGKRLDVVQLARLLG